jgi:hypothetical protein
MENQLGALCFVLNAVVLFSTRYMDAAVAELRAGRFEVRDEDVACLSPCTPAPASTCSAGAPSTREDALNGIRVIRSDRGAHAVPDIDHKRQVLPGTVRVEVPPVNEVA